MEQFTEMKKEIKICKKDVEELTELNKKMEVEIESKFQIDNAVDLLKSNNQKVTNRCSELEAQLSFKQTQLADTD